MSQGQTRLHEMTAKDLRPRAETEKAQGDREIKETVKTDGNNVSVKEEGDREVNISMSAF